MLASSMTLGVVLLTAAITTHAFKRIPKLRNWTYLISGLLLAASLGQLGATVANAIITRTSGVTLAWGLGASLLFAALDTFLVCLLFHSLPKKKGKPQGWHGPVFFFTPAIIAISSGAGLAILTALTAALQGNPTPPTGG